jgi:hypothetical protein
MSDGLFLLFLVSFIIQCVGIGIIMTKIEDVTDMLLKIQEEDTQRRIAERLVKKPEDNL